MSYMYYSFVGTLVTVFVGIIVSFMTASDQDEFDDHLLHPCVLRFTKWMKQKKAEPSSITNSQVVFENQGFQFSNGDGCVSNTSTNNTTTTMDTNLGVGCDNTKQTLK